MYATSLAVFQKYLARESSLHTLGKWFPDAGPDIPHSGITAPAVRRNVPSHIRVSFVLEVEIRLAAWHRECGNYPFAGYLAGRLIPPYPLKPKWDGVKFNRSSSPRHPAERPTSISTYLQASYN
jgi:hypothetical protein